MSPYQMLARALGKAKKFKKIKDQEERLKSLNFSTATYSLSQHLIAYLLHVCMYFFGALAIPFMLIFVSKH